MVSTVPRAIALWPLPLVGGLMPALAAVLAVVIYTGEVGHSCNPFFDDCVSISRMARHGAAIHLFRALVLPGAVLQLLTWLAVCHAFSAAGVVRRDVLPLAIIGTCAGIALVVYGSFLGSDGEVYRWLRRWGTIIYFGGTYLAMLLFARASQRVRTAHPLALPRAHHRILLALLGFIAALGLLHGFASLWASAALENHIENLVEWWGSAALTLAFVTMASLWRRWRLVATVSLG